MQQFKRVWNVIVAFEVISSLATAIPMGGAIAMLAMPDWSVALAVMIIFPLYGVAVGVMLRLYNIRIEKRRAQSVRLITEAFDLTWAQNSDALQTISDLIDSLHKDKVDSLVKTRFEEVLAI